ncbi:Macrolide export ATP-binding/permease protein MacB [Phycisphaerae bacterium RAS1]|nr:Macrolide export ATP-binding/permease protein MacB [Phycisphaerae bacterium RAS1]
MFLLEMLHEALRNLWRHRLRSLLTTLGIVFGVASVLSMVAIGEGARQAILSQIEELGIRNIIINAQKPPESESGKETQKSTLEYGLTFADARQIDETLPAVDRVLPVHDIEKWIWFRSRRIAAKVRGVTPEYFEHLRLRPFVGRALEQRDEDERRRVCVVRARLLSEARYVGDPLKLDLKVGMEYFRVVGVLPDYEFQSPTKAVLRIDERALEVYVPFETVTDRFGMAVYQERSGSAESTRVELHQIVCTVRSEADVLPAARGIRAVLAALHKQADYQVTVPLQELASKQRTQQVFNTVLPIIAGISLLVGGIGILNIMLASITERTREIGVRRAIGASGSDITWQFLIETVTLAMIGGLLGVVVGIGGVFVLEFATKWQAVITAWSLLLAMGVSCLTGIIFGIYPARRAAAMNPIDALRHA